MQSDIDIRERSRKSRAFNPAQDLRRKILRECHGLLLLGEKINGPYY